MDADVAAFAAACLVYAARRGSREIPSDARARVQELLMLLRAWRGGEVFRAECVGGDIVGPDGIRLAELYDAALVALRQWAAASEAPARADIPPPDTALLFRDGTASHGWTMRDVVRPPSLQPIIHARVVKLWGQLVGDAELVMSSPSRTASRGVPQAGLDRAAAIPDYEGEVDEDEAPVFAADCAMMDSYVSTWRAPA